MLLKAQMRRNQSKSHQTIYSLNDRRCYLKARFFLLIGSVRSLSGVFGRTLGGMIETLEGVGEGGEWEGEEERKSSTSPLRNERIEKKIPKGKEQF